MIATHEDHLHLLVCIDRLNAAWRTLGEIASNPKHPLAGPAFRYALVEYATVFSRSDGYQRRRTLSPECVPANHLALHQRIMAARHSIHAHADLTVLNARIEVGYINGHKHIGHIQDYIHGLEELPNLSHVSELIERVMDTVYEMHRASKLAIEP